jgi:hypothetical protein
MRQVFYILIPFAILSCNNQSSEKTVAVNTDTAASKTEVHQTETPKVQAPPPPDSTYADRNNFTTKYGLEQIDTLNASYSKNPNIKTTIRKDIYKGDSCISYKSMTNPSNGMTLHQIKGDVKGNGYFNKQFVLFRDTILMMHELTVARISNQPGWMAKESIWFFDKGQTRSATKQDMANEFKDIDPAMKNVPFEMEFFFETSMYQRKLRQLNHFLNMKGGKK